jgi:hypothetical protein
MLSHSWDDHDLPIKKYGPSILKYKAQSIFWWSMTYNFDSDRFVLYYVHNICIKYMKWNERILQDESNESLYTFPIHIVWYIVVVKVPYLRPEKKY